MPRTISQALAYPQQLTELATIAGGSWLAAAPVTNVATWPLAETAESTNADAASTIVTIDHGSAKSARLLWIPRGHNLPSGSTIRWKRGTTAGGVDVGDVTQNAWRFTPSAYDGSLWPAFVLQSANASARYERIEFSITGSSLILPRIFIAPIWAPTWNSSYGHRDGVDDLSDESESESGADWVNVKRRRRWTSFVLEHLSRTEGDTMHSLELEHGITGEIVYLPDLDDLERTQRRGFLGRSRELSGVEWPVSLENSKGFELKERV